MCLTDVLSNCLATNAGCPTGDPKTLIPCSSKPIPGPDPFHHCGCWVICLPPSKISCQMRISEVSVRCRRARISAGADARAVSILHQIPPFTFFFQKIQNSESVHSKKMNNRPGGHSQTQPPSLTKPERDTYLASTSTSAEEGVGPSDPNATRRSRRERANALAALQAKRQLQRHNRACRARLLVALGRPRTFALANCRRKSWHSPNHLTWRNRVDDPSTSSTSQSGRSPDFGPGEEFERPNTSLIGSTLLWARLELPTVACCMARRVC